MDYLLWFANNIIVMVEWLWFCAIWRWRRELSALSRRRFDIQRGTTRFWHSPCPLKPPLIRVSPAKLDLLWLVIKYCLQLKFKFGRRRRKNLKQTSRECKQFQLAILLHVFISLSLSLLSPSPSSKPDEVVRSNVPFLSCLEGFAQPQEVPDFYSTAVGAKSTARK